MNNFKLFDIGTCLTRNHSCFLYLYTHQKFQPIETNYSQIPKKNLFTQANYICSLNLSLLFIAMVNSKSETIFKWPPWFRRYGNVILQEDGVCKGRDCYYRLSPIWHKEISLAPSASITQPSE